MGILWVIGGVVVLIIYIKLTAPIYKRNHNEAVERARNKETVKRVAEGDKPFGAPFAGSAYGAAYFLSTQQLIEKDLAEDHNELLDTSLIFLGAHGTESNGGHIDIAHLYAPKEGHIITVAPTRTSKGACHVIPNLLHYEGSVVVYDIKGENADITQRFRINLGHKVYRFAPFEEEGVKWNPLDFIRDSGNKGSDAGTMADMLIMDDGGEEAFWTNEAKNFLSGVIMYVMINGKPEERTMETVRGCQTNCVSGHVINSAKGDFRHGYQSKDYRRTFI